MKRYDIIKYLIEKNNYRSYLEIGVLGNETFNCIQLDTKHGVDPNVDTTYRMTSDEFFANHCKQKYDIVFIDGLHLREQVLKDIENSLANLNENGIIVVHDCLPTEEWHQLREGVPGQPWTGDVWKAFAELRNSRCDLEMITIDTDWGCGIIKKTVPLITWSDSNPPRVYTWEDFKKCGDLLLGVITVEEFLNGSI